MDWFSHAKEQVSSLHDTHTMIKKAKNVILFIGDGMGLSTVTAARYYKGELSGNTGPEVPLSFEYFPHSALSKVNKIDRRLFVFTGVCFGHRKA